ncbi:MAG: hypothetical protein IPL01_16595 [Acidobacteria bacterium]|nr:hypothetical protein [Acidobacteriota bacterium]
MFRKAGGRRLIEHGGSWQGFKSFIARYVDDKMTVIVFANLAQDKPRTGSLTASRRSWIHGSRFRMIRSRLKVNAMIKDILTKCIDGSVSQDALRLKLARNYFPIRSGDSAKP